MTPTAIPGLPAEPGLWVFVLGDMTVFGWFFLVFMWENRQDRELFAESVVELYQPIGVLNTLVLLLSSLLVVLALHAHRPPRPSRALSYWCRHVRCGIREYQGCRVLARDRQRPQPG